MFRNFFLINALHRVDVSLRDHFPLGDAADQIADQSLISRSRLVSPVSALRRRRRRMTSKSAGSCANPTPGKISVSLEREPDLRLAAAIDGMSTTSSWSRTGRRQNHRIGSVRSARDCSMASRSVSAICRSFASIIAAGRRFGHPRRLCVFATTARILGVKLYLTSIAADNVPARWLLTRACRDADVSAALRFRYAPLPPPPQWRFQQSDRSGSRWSARSWTHAAPRRAGTDTGGGGPAEPRGICADSLLPPGRPRSLNHLAGTACTQTIFGCCLMAAGLSRAPRFGISARRDKRSVRGYSTALRPLACRSICSRR